MTVIVCDACGKEMPNAVRGDSVGKGVDYITYMDKDFCVDCYDELEFTVRKISRQRDPFVLGENKEIVRQVVEQMCGTQKRK